MIEQRTSNVRVQPNAGRLDVPSRSVRERLAGGRRGLRETAWLMSQVDAQGSNLMRSFS